MNRMLFSGRFIHPLRPAEHEGELADQRRSRGQKNHTEQQHLWIKCARSSRYVRLDSCILRSNARYRTRPAYHAM